MYIRINPAFLHSLGTFAIIPLASKTRRVSISLLLCRTVVYVEQVEFRGCGKYKRLWLEFQLRPLYVVDF